MNARKPEAEFVQTELENFELQLAQGSIKKAMQQAGAKSRDLWQVERDHIHVLPNFNVRLTNTERYKKKIRYLADSMKKEGYIQSKALEGYVADVDGKQIIYLTDGHGRLEAYDLAVSEGAELGRLPMVIVPPGTSQEDLQVSLYRHNEGGEKLAPYELALLCKRLSKMGMDTKEIADRLEIGEKYTDDLLALMSADIKLREMVMNDLVAAGIAIEMLRKHGIKAAQVLQAELDKVQGTGGKKLTKKHLPEQIFKKKVTKAAPTLFNVMRDVKSDPGYEYISEELRERLDKLMSEFGDLLANGDTKPADDEMADLID